MASYLENVPDDILQYIARLTVWPSPFESLTNLLHLLLTSSTIHRRLAIRNSPHLYARLFQSKFDMAAPRRRLDPSVFTDSTIAGELVSRYRVFRRMRRRDLDSPGITQDMWTLYWLILESDKLNAVQLTSARHTEFLLDMIFSQLRKGDTEKYYEHEALSLSLWAYCLTVSSRDIRNIPPDRIQDLLVLLRPIVMSPRRDIGTNHPANPSQPPEARSVQHTYYAGLLCLHNLDNQIRLCLPESRLACPSAQSAAIILTFVLKELVPLQAPPHLPPNRVTAIAQNRAGPTMEDYRALLTCRTPLLNDLATSFSPPQHSNTVPTSLNVTQSMRCEEDFSRVLNLQGRSSSIHTTTPYTVGTLSGLWEGTFLISPIPSTFPSSSPPFAEDFVARQPLYCQLTEYLCFTQETSVPALRTSRHEHSTEALDVLPDRIMPVKGESECSSNTYHYEKVEEAKRPYSPTAICPKINHAVIIGETPTTQEEAWGGYRFSGTVRLSDGFVTLKRSSKDILDDPPWIFEGYLHYGSAFVGTWRTHGNPCSVQGVFSLRRRSSEDQDAPTAPTPAY
ncbi:hypothetical protein ONZ45_g1210 [Pleurotus djamor]|nr:hypothetical protein ONZ45_g1210 [Pleurotus djamor]